MYERRFGISGPPFQLSPDPSFYFDAEQHRKALTALRGAFTGDLPFVVISGEIGAGKTTVIRTWLAELQQAGVPSALVTNTQLDAEGLLSAIAFALGVEGGTAPAGGALPALRRHLHGLPGHALAVAIDEAQNLGHEALAGLVDLARGAAEEGARLCIVLAGQPELRAHVADHALAQLQALVQQACHLEPLRADQTRRYVEHRLLKVGWSGSPSFDASAFDEIHRLAGGVPRRINVIANRLLLGQFLSDTTHVNGDAVRDIARMLDAEIAEGRVFQTSPVREAARPSIPLDEDVVLLLASGRSDYIKAMALISALDMRFRPTRPVVVGLRNPGYWRLNSRLLEELVSAPSFVDLSVAGPLHEEGLEQRFEAILDTHHPRAVLAFDGDGLAHRCAALARRRGVPLAQVGADAQLANEARDPASSRAAIARLASLHFGCQAAAHDAVSSPEQRPTMVGSLLVDALRLATQLPAHRSADNPALAPAADLLRESQRGFGVAVFRPRADPAAAPIAPEVLNLLKDLSRDLPLVLPARIANRRVSRRGDLRRELQGDRIALVDELAYVDLVRLMREATFVITDSPDVAEETAILGVPCMTVGMRHVGLASAGGWLGVADVSAGAAVAAQAVWQILFRGVARSKLPGGWDGHTGLRIARMLEAWLVQLRGAESALGGPRPNARHPDERAVVPEVNSLQQP